MPTSAEVASHAGLSRSTVSQILNGREHLFSDETIARVRKSAAELGYRPSLAGRTLRRGTSDIVITLIPETATFNPRLRELVDVITHGLAEKGYTNLLRFIGSAELLEDAILDLKPYGVVSLTPLPDTQRERLLAHGAHLVEQPVDVQVQIDRAMGALQAQHLADAGYTTIAPVAPVADGEQSYALPRAEGARHWAEEHGIHVLPTIELAPRGDAAVEAVRALPASPVGIAAYNDELAAAVVSAAIDLGRSVPRDLGVVGIDNSPIATALTPSITTVDYDIPFSGRVVVEMLLGITDASSLADIALDEVTTRLRIVQGATTPDARR